MFGERSFVNQRKLGTPSWLIFFLTEWHCRFISSVRILRLAFPSSKLNGAVQVAKVI